MAIVKGPFHGHLPALDGVRGLAILMVLLVHFIGDLPPANRFEQVLFHLATYGSFGVDLFFVLSGFLITGILYDSKQAPGFFRNFYIRRTLRIFPLYYATLAVLFLVVPRVPVFEGAALDEMVRRQGWAWAYAINVHISREGTWSLASPPPPEFAAWATLAVVWGHAPGRRSWRIDQRSERATVKNDEREQEAQR